MFIIDDEIISGFIGEAVSRSVDFSWTKIKEVVKNRKNKHQSIESQIYNVIVNVLNQITYNEFENDQDKIYQATENLLIGYKKDRCDTIEVVRSGLQILGESVNNDKYMEFKILLYQELCKKDYEELYRQIELLQQDEESSKNSRIEEKVDKVQQSVDETNRKLDSFKESYREVDNVQNKKPIKSRIQEYAGKWEANMFLNDFDKRDENAGINVKLREVYLEEHLPHYIWYKNNENEPSTDLKELLSEYIDEKRDSKMFLILGQPGIGKSTLITWIVANLCERIDDILVYRFASDLRNVDWKDGRISNKVLEELGLSHSDLNGKTLIIDGFDEVNIESNRRRDILDSLYGDWINNKTIENFSLIITCRENYVSQFAILNCKYITLKPWDETQIRSFCNIFQEKTKNSVSMDTIEKLLENKEILGIPLILYMTLALNISVEKEGSIVDVYDKIFSLEGGIYDRCIDNKKFGDNHRIGEVKEQIHQISREIALWMFENNPDMAIIPQKNYKNICIDIMRKKEKEHESLEQDFLIGNYFKLVRHCEGIETQELSFVHRSIYEYFVIENICNNAIELIIKKSDNESFRELSEKIACICGMFLYGNRLSINMLDYMRHKIKNSILNDSFSVINEAFQIMLNEGMTYYTGRCYKNVVICEMNVFGNMLEIVHLWDDKIIDYNEKLVDYIHCNRETKLNLKKLDLRKANLRRANLSGIDLEEANLEEADLQEANLTRTNLKNANLKNAVLKDVILNNTVLTGTSFYGVNLDNIDLKKAEITAKDVNGAIYYGKILSEEDIVGSDLLKEY